MSPKPRQATPQNNVEWCELEASPRDAPSEHMGFGWTLASAWFYGSSQAKSVRPLFVLQRRIPKLLAIPGMTLLF
jgi:hypothetical protein